MLSRDYSEISNGQTFNFLISAMSTSCISSEPSSNAALLMALDKPTITTIIATGLLAGSIVVFGLVFAGKMLNIAEPLYRTCALTWSEDQKIALTSSRVIYVYVSSTRCHDAPLCPFIRAPLCVSVCQCVSKRVCIYVYVRVFACTCISCVCAYVCVCVCVCVSIA